ncbi:MAG TPA: DUF2252 family protein [Trebonia sp.]
MCRRSERGQASSDIFLGWVRIDAGMDGKPHDFYVRQLRDWKFSFDIAAMVPVGMRLREAAASGRITAASDV